MLDGLQCSTFATLGKGNLVVRKSSGRSVAVRVNKGRKTWTFKITLRALDICLHADDLAKSARRILRMRASDLWS